MLAGCANSEDTSKETSDDGSVVDPEGNSIDAGDATSTGAADVITLMVLVIALGNETMADNGTFAVPADTHITFDATNSTGNITTFSWTSGNMTADGAAVNMTFPAGNHTLVLTALGPNNVTANLTFELVATSMEAAEAILVGSTPIKFSHAAESKANGCLTTNHALFLPLGTETRQVMMTLDPTWTGVALDISYKLILFDSDNQEVAKSTRTGGSANLVLDAVGRALPGGDYSARGEVCGTVLPQVSFTVNGEAFHFA
jgi:hypothetical protein